jgi:hypothetical protein
MLFCHMLTSKMCLDFNQFPPDFSTTEDHHCNNTQIDWWRTIWRRIRICCAICCQCPLCKRRINLGSLHWFLGDLFQPTTSFFLGIVAQEGQSNLDFFVTYFCNFLVPFSFSYDIFASLACISLMISNFSLWSETSEKADFFSLRSELNFA